jgi:hypothetical protein
MNEIRTRVIFVAQSNISILVSSAIRSYCNGFDQGVARQELGKQLPLVLHVNNGESIIFHNLLYIICRICNKCICSISTGT